MPHPVDVHVGKRIRQRRLMLGLTQQALAENVGIKFQQVQKYETGKNRVSSSKLWDIGKTLSSPVSWFFAGMEGDMPSPAPAIDALDDAQLRASFEAGRTIGQLTPAQRAGLLNIARLMIEAGKA